MPGNPPLTPEERRLITRQPAGPYLIESWPHRPVAGPQPLPEPPSTLAVERLVWQICHFTLAPLRLVSAFVSADRRRRGTGA